jgi:hypothetical protein
MLCTKVKYYMKFLEIEIYIESQTTYNNNNIFYIFFLDIY